MASYGVTDDPDGLLPWAWAEERLLTTRNFWFVTCDGAGRPHSMPVWGVWMPDVERWGTSCAPTARKARNLRANDRVVVTTDDGVECVSIEGRAVRLAGDEVDHMARAWALKYADLVEAHTEEQIRETIEFVRGNAAYAVIPERAFGMIETPERFATAATRWVWD
ncbi:MAG: hypothetical protein GWN48_05310 [Actinobacteria bacterium]|nr:hypothetical protein [Actinomycetota bacterium]